MYDPSRGWIAYVKEGGSGLGAVFDYKRVLSYRTAQTPIPTMEWIFRKADFKPGTVEKTPVRLAAFAGLNEVSTVGEACAVEMQVIDFTFNSTALPTPHRVWAKPYAGGRPRVLRCCPKARTARRWN